jgi:C-terminal processing protease CtpA/Prc
MKNVRFWGFAALLALAVVAGIAWLAPAAHTQSKPTWTQRSDDGQVVIEREIREPVVRLMETLGGGGSQIGVGIRDLPEADIKAGKSGVQIEDVRESSPAARAGFKTGDVVASFDGERVRSARQFARLVQETPAGRAVKSQVIRDGKSVDLTVTPSAPDRTADDNLKRRFEFHTQPPGAPGHRMMVPEIPDLPHQMFDPGDHLEFQIFSRPGRLGVGVQSLTPELAEYFGVKEGVLVTSVATESAAAKAGIKAGDVITTVDGKTVDDAGELRRLLRPEDEKDTEVTLGVVRDKKAMSMKVTLEAPKAVKEKSVVRRTI